MTRVQKEKLGFFPYTSREDSSIGDGRNQGESIQPPHFSPPASTTGACGIRRAGETLPLTDQKVISASVPPPFRPNMDGYWHATRPCKRKTFAHKLAKEAVKDIHGEDATLGTVRVCFILVSLNYLLLNCEDQYSSF